MAIFFRQCGWSDDFVSDADWGQHGGCVRHRSRLRIWRCGAVGTFSSITSLHAVGMTSNLQVINGFYIYNKVSGGGTDNCPPYGDQIGTYDGTSNYSEACADIVGP